MVSFQITQTYAFVDSQVAKAQPKTKWPIEFIGKRKRARAETKLSDGDWQKAVAFVKTLLPSILYFPNFLFEFPDRIYLVLQRQLPE